jgi:hypothetical protein
VNMGASDELIYADILRLKAIILPH